MSASTPAKHHVQLAYFLLLRLSSNLAAMSYAARLLSLCVVALCILQGCAQSDAGLDLPEAVDFNYHIRPILSNSCFVCHGPDVSTREADLRLDTRAYATARREGGKRAIAPRSPGRSLLIKKVTADDPDQRMPPQKTNKILTPREIALLTKWIEQGAQYKQHWAFISPELPMLPEGANAIDWLLEDRVQRARLIPAPEAPKEVYCCDELPMCSQDCRQSLAWCMRFWKTARPMPTRE